jgi:hypothetical protein
MSGKRWRACNSAGSTGGVHVFRTCVIPRTGRPTGLDRENLHLLCLRTLSAWAARRSSPLACVVWGGGSPPCGFPSDRRWPKSPANLLIACWNVRTNAGVERASIVSRDLGQHAISIGNSWDRAAWTRSASPDPTQVGRQTVRAAAGNLKKVSFEPGGKSPAIVLPDADLSQAIPGQRPLAPRAAGGAESGRRLADQRPNRPTKVPRARV